jgi:hypothetical protein
MSGDRHLNFYETQDNETQDNLGCGAGRELGDADTVFGHWCRKAAYADSNPAPAVDQLTARGRRASLLTTSIVFMLGPNSKAILSANSAGTGKCGRLLYQNGAGTGVPDSAIVTLSRCMAGLQPNRRAPAVEANRLMRLRQDSNAYRFRIVRGRVP